MIEGTLVDPLVHVAGFDYHHPSAEDAWRRIFSFFDLHLRGGESAGPVPWFPSAAG